MRSLGIALVIAVLGCAATATAATEAERVIARKTSSGGFALATATGSVKRPVLVRIEIASTPAQPVQVTWRLRCFRGESAATRRGQFRVTAPHARRVLFPLAKPSRCTLSATGQLEREGTITVTLRAR